MGEKCKTNYPIMMVHGTGFRDRKHFDYWGRITKLLKSEGALVFYGNQDSWGSVEQNAQVLKCSIEKFINETGHERVNVIAHSKGGLEMRYLISSLSMEEKIASLTTISTPHYGSKTMSCLWKLPNVIFKIIAWFVNLFFKLLGDKNPDFYLACKQFTQEYAQFFNEQNPDIDGIYYQSYASVMKNVFSDLFMSIPYIVTYIIEGENDGLVTPHSAKWTNFKGILRSVSNRGISHADVVDLRRKRFSRKIKSNFISDITDVYIEIVSNLKNLGK